MRRVHMFSMMAMLAVAAARLCTPNADVVDTFNTTGCTFVVMDMAVGQQVLFGSRAANGKEPIVETLAKSSDPLFHEAGIWLPKRRQVLFTSDRICHQSECRTVISLVNVDTGFVETLHPDPPVVMANGGVALPGSSDVVLLCSQGLQDSPGGLVALDLRTGASHVVTSGRFGRYFSSLNDVVLIPHPDSELVTAVFTDPPYGCDQEFRPSPDFPPYVWAITLRLPWPSSGQWWPTVVQPAYVVSDRFIRPNGLAWANGTLFVSDTAFISGGLKSPADCGPPILERSGRPRAVYSYKIQFQGSRLDLTNIDFHSTPDFGYPDGISTASVPSTVLTGEGSGVGIYSSTSGFLLLRVQPNASPEGGTVANFALADAAPLPGVFLIMGCGKILERVYLPGLRP
eukprot:NODE_2074_length_1305_cov_30.747611_g1887_i0.p1 GENE.NODE_2074_length_1305_cov_30.747611_g1887_i0~~NODE_2074_length_1305_cov_30.747611_g1887_i0.p1  ORF type:complete len:416 (-),score=64.66 NODE_2074_length_1305_cov_30.747611_g1887_i0:56-1255(-)